MYGYIDSDGTKKNEMIPYDKCQSFMTHFFNENGLFSNNWTDVQILLDFLTNNIKLGQDANIILKNTIKGYLSTKLKNSNVEIIVEIKDAGLEPPQDGMLINIMTNDNEANGTVKVFDSKLVKNNEPEKTTQRELSDYFFESKEKFEPEVEPPKSSSSKSNRFTFPNSTSSVASESDTSDPGTAVYQSIKYIIDNVPIELTIGNCYLENFMRTIHNIEQYQKNRVNYRHVYYDTYSGSDINKSISPYEIFPFIRRYFSPLESGTNLDHGIVHFVQIINQLVSEGKDVKRVITEAIWTFLKNTPGVTVTIDEDDHLNILVRTDGPIKTETLKFEKTNLVNQNGINDYKKMLSKRYQSAGGESSEIKIFEKMYLKMMPNATKKELNREYKKYKLEIYLKCK
jgi:hypothetical protein